MKKTISLENGQEIKLNNNAGWILEYRDQFGHDIIPVLMPLLSALVDIIGDGIITDTGSIKGKDILQKLNQDSINDALIELSGMEMTTFLHIIWSMAKVEDDSIDEPKRWIRQFDVFPLDVIIPEAAKLIIEGVVSSKNLSSLHKTINEMKVKAKKKESTPTQSLSQQQAAV